MQLTVFQVVIAITEVKLYMAKFDLVFKGFSSANLYAC